MGEALQKYFVAGSILISLASCYHAREASSTLNNASHPPVPTASWPPLPSNFSDIPSKSLECWNSKFSFSFTTYFLWTEAAKSVTPIVTTFTPPQTNNRTYSITQEIDCSTKNFGLTTLCDGIPRAESRSSKCSSTSFLTSDVWIRSSSILDYITATWTSDFKPTQPKCAVAPDDSAICTRMYEAWSYRSSQLKSEKTLDPSYLATVYNMIAPRCTISVPAETTYTGTMCRMIAPTYSIYYWPTPAPNGSEFCSSSARPMGTITQKPSTTVVSGHTLTSPSVYHFLKDVRVESYLFDQQRYNLSVSIPSDQVLTVAQHEADILSASITCRGRELDYCSAFFIPDFRVNDISTVRKGAYERNCRCGMETIYQSNYKPSLAIAISEVVRQNEKVEGRNCDWDLWGGYVGNTWISGVESAVPAVVFEDVKRTAFVPITVETRKGVETGVETGVPVPRGVVKAIPMPTADM